MAQILDQIAYTRLAYLTGTAAEARTVPDGASVVAWTLSASGAGVATLDITPGGPGQKPIALETITVPAGKSDTDETILMRLGPGSVFTFAGQVNAYRISIAYQGGS